MSRQPEITILLATYNRAAILRETLEHFTRLDHDGPRFEVLVVDNNSTDNTCQTVADFSGRLAARYLFEPRPGKNCALNAGLRDPDLAPLVVFTDDDITPAHDWLIAIKAAADRWSDYDIFGGRIDVVWPVQTVPGWAKVPWIASFGFAQHDYAPQDTPYAPNDYPFGPNFWLRRRVLTPDVRFDETVGPHPTNRILGDEIIFVQRLRRKGHAAMYCPAAVVGHRIEAATVTERGIRRRAWTLGRGAPYVSGLCRADLLARSPLRWRLLRYAALVKYCAAWLAAHASLTTDRRVERAASAILNLAYNTESLRIAARTPESPTDTAPKPGTGVAPGDTGVSPRGTGVSPGGTGVSPGGTGVSPVNNTNPSASPHHHTASADGPLVTVIICVYNAGPYLRPSVESILHQTYRDLEILIIDDGSTDGCMDTIADLDDPRIRILTQPNAGKPAALNRALEHLRGDFFAIHDADDISHPQRIARQLEALLADPDLGVVFTGYELILDGRHIAPTFAPRDKTQCAADIAAFRMPAHDATAMFRTACTRGLRYEPTLALGEGRDFILQVCERHAACVLGRCLYAYRIHRDSITVRQQTRRAEFDALVIRRACRRRGLPESIATTAVTETNDKQRSLVAHFMESVANQTEAGQRRAALRTAWQCVHLSPLSPYYYRPLVYALAPRGLVRAYRQRKQRRQRASLNRETPAECPTSR